MSPRACAVLLPIVLGLSACASQAAGPASGVRPAATPGPAGSHTPKATGPASQTAPPDTTNKKTEPKSADTGVSTDRNAAGFAAWVTSYERRARARGISRATLDDAFGDAEFLPHVIALDNRQPEFHRAIWEYLDVAASDARVANGREKLATYRDTANEMAARYGVPGNIITAIWGMESNYGANFGDYETVDALATLGYDGRRESFAENQLDAALKILAAGDIPRHRMRGSWAGAMGNTQFLPTSFIAYAVDADGDGRRDIWGSVPDTMASTANYLARNGWRRGEPWGREVRLPANFDYAMADGDTDKSPAAWAAAGVTPIDSRGLPKVASAAIIAPAGASGPAFMVGHNFNVILRYNNAVSYALGVALLADRIAGEPGVQAAWPRDAATLSTSQTRALQRGLNALGYGAGGADGIMGPNTRQALRDFQRAEGLPADGFATVALFNRVQNAQAR